MQKESQKVADNFVTMLKFLFQNAKTYNIAHAIFKVFCPLLLGF
jgi:hypothetical protein